MIIYLLALTAIAGINCDVSHLANSQDIGYTYNKQAPFVDRSYLPIPTQRIPVTTTAKPVYLPPKIFSNDKGLFKSPIFTEQIKQKPVAQKIPQKAPQQIYLPVVTTPKPKCPQDGIYPNCYVRTVPTTTKKPVCQFGGVWPNCQQPTQRPTTRLPITQAPKYLPPKIYTNDKPVTRATTRYVPQTTTRYIPPTTRKPITSPPTYLPPKIYTTDKPVTRTTTRYVPPTTTRKPITQAPTYLPPKIYTSDKPVIRVTTPTPYLPPRISTPGPTYLPLACPPGKTLNVYRQCVEPIVPCSNGGYGPNCIIDVTEVVYHCKNGGVGPDCITQRPIIHIPTSSRAPFKRPTTIYTTTPIYEKIKPQKAFNLPQFSTL